MNYIININHRIITSCYRRQKHFFSQLICNKNNYKVIKNINYIIQSQRNFSSNNNIINIEANPDIRSILDNGFVENPKMLICFKNSDCFLNIIGLISPKP